MSKKHSKDLALKALFNNKKYFADVFNNFIFKGNNIIDPDTLIDDNPELIFKNSNGEISNRDRDLLKKATFKKDNKVGYLLLGIENQTTVDKDMIFRIMQYDSLSYMRQLDIAKEKKDGKIKAEIIQVLTLVIYYGKGNWTAPLDLYSRFNTDAEFRELFPNYSYKVLNPNKLDDNEIDKYDKGLKCLFTYMKYQNDKQKLEEKITNNKEYEKIDNTVVDCINILTDSNLRYDEGEEEINMCKAIKDMRDEAKQEGIQEEHDRMCKAIKDMRDEAKAEGKQEGIQEGLQQGKAEERENNIKLMSNNGASVETIAKLLNLDLAYVKTVLAK